METGECPTPAYSRKLAPVAQRGGPLSPLELQLRIKQNEPDALTHKGRRVLTERTTGHHGHWIREIAVIPEVHEIRTNLELCVLTQPEGLRQAGIPLLEPGSSEGIAAQVAATRHRIGKNA